MTLNDIRERVEGIRNGAEKRSDPEGLHIDLDSLFIDVLKDIAAGGKQAQEKASEALKADEIEFPRWYS